VFVTNVVENQNIPGTNYILVVNAKNDVLTTVNLLKNGIDREWSVPCLWPIRICCHLLFNCALDKLVWQMFCCSGVEVLVL
jgi:hypothetical protein